MPVAPAPRRRRRRDARDNDTLILDAAVTVAATEGWSGLLAPRLSAVTGLSSAPIRERFRDRGELAAALWRHRVSDYFFTRLKAVVAATPHPDASSAYSNPEAMLAALEPFQEHDDVMLAASELLIMARFDPQVADAVAGSWQGWAESWLLPEPGRLAPSQAARHAFALSLALGLLVMGRGVPQPAARIDDLVPPVMQALDTRVDPQPLPVERAEHLDLGAMFDTDDPAWNALLQATLDEVGRHGYDGATLENIARSAGYSRGIIQNRYANKKEIVLDATRRMLGAAVVLNDGYIQRIAATYSRGLAEAATIREFMAPERRLVRSISFEQLRLAWHDRDIAEVMASEVAQAREATGRGPDGEAQVPNAVWQFGLAVGQGVGVLADLHPAAATLPFDVVTTPLAEVMGGG